jgi:hypothetical protein
VTFVHFNDVHKGLCEMSLFGVHGHHHSSKVIYLLAYGRWFSQGTLASSTTKTGRHDIAEILMKVELNSKNQPTIKRYVKYQATVNLLLL